MIRTTKNARLVEGFPHLKNKISKVGFNKWGGVVSFSFLINRESMPLPIKVKLNPCMITKGGLGGSSHGRSYYIAQVSCSSYIKKLPSNPLIKCSCTSLQEFVIHVE